MRRLSHGPVTTGKAALIARDQTPLDIHGRRTTKVVAIDATSFFSYEAQFNPQPIFRGLASSLAECLKAFAGFQTNEQPASAIATGNWGCGAFKGDPQLKVTGS